MQKFSLASPLFDKMSDKRTDYFTIGTMADFATLANSLPFHAMYFNGGYKGKWVANMDLDTAKQCAVSGHLPSAAASDKFLAEVENLIPAPTARQEWRDDVTGALPNIPAFLAGQPLTMRRRVRQENEAAPIAIVCDMVLSAGINTAQMQKRGSAILALARAISSKRPVELWVGTSVQAHQVHACHYYFRVDTSPLDLARAAFLMAHPAAVRGIMYSLAERDYNFGGHWAYADHDILRKRGEKVMRGMLPHLTDLIYVPGAHVTDETVTKPVEWVKANVKAALGQDLDEAA